MAQKRTIKITSPRGSVVTRQTKNGSVSAEIVWNSGFARKKGQAFESAQEFVDSECIRCMEPLTPRRTGMMIKSAKLGTVIGSGNIEYLAPYARSQSKDKLLELCSKKTFGMDIDRLPMLRGHNSMMNYDLA